MRGPTLWFVLAFLGALAPSPRGACADEEPRAQGRVLRIGLRDAVSLAAHGNLTLLERSYDTPIAMQERLAAEAAFDHLLTADFALAHDERPVTNVFLGSGVTIDNRVSSQVGLTRALRQGGSVSLLYRIDRLSTNNPFATVDPAWTQTVSVEATQPLLRGAGDVALADIRRAQNGMAAARAGQRTEMEAVLLAVAEAFFELVYADVELDARRNSRDLAAELLEDARARLDAEVGTPLDVAEARAGLERRRSDVLEAENLRRTLEDRLLALVLPFDARAREPVRVVPVLPAEGEAPVLPDPVPSDEDGPGSSAEARLVNLAVQGRPELLASRAEVATLGIDVRVARDAVRPQLDLVGRVASDGLDDGFGASLEDVSGGRAVSGSIGLEFSLFLGQRAARSTWLAAAWRRRQALVRQRELVNQIVVEVRAGLRDVATAHGRIEAGRSEVEAAAEGLDGERSKLGQGKSTPFRVLEKEEDLTAARTRLGRAEADLRIARARLWRATGTLGDAFDVAASRWPPCTGAR